MHLGWRLGAGCMLAAAVNSQSAPITVVQHPACAVWVAACSFSRHFLWRTPLTCRAPFPPGCLQAKKNILSSLPGGGITMSPPRGNQLTTQAAIFGALAAWTLIQVGQWLRESVGICWNPLAGAAELVAPV